MCNTLSRNSVINITTIFYAFVAVYIRYEISKSKKFIRGGPTEGCTLSFVSDK